MVEADNKRQSGLDYTSIKLTQRDSPDKLTQEEMTDDLAALLDHLKTGPVNVVGWSDGGIEALLLAIRHPGKVKAGV